MDIGKREAVFWLVLVFGILLIILGSLLIGQGLRNDRAATIEADPFSVSLSVNATEDYSCSLFQKQIGAFIREVTIYCQPHR